MKAVPCGSLWKTRSVFQGAVGAVCASTAPTASTGRGRCDKMAPEEAGSTENPCVGLRADHHVEAFCLELGSQVLEVEPGQSGEPVFIELPWLGVGQHTLRASARAAGDEPVPEAAVLDIQIREPRVWVPGFGSQSAFLVVVDPSAPTLEQLWEGGRRSRCTGLALGTWRAVSPGSTKETLCPSSKSNCRG